MVFEIDPDKPDIPALARILSAMGLLSLLGSIIALLLAFSGYDWVNEIYAMAGAVGAFLLALVFVGQAKTLELLAVVSARLKSRFAIDALAKTAPGMSSSTAVTPSLTPPSQSFARPGAAKERIIHVPDEEARQQGFKVR